MFKTLLVISVMALTVSCNDKKGGAGKADITTDDGKFSYSVGHEIGRNMKRQGVKLHYGSFIAGVQDVMTDKKILLDETQRRDAMKKMAEKKQAEDKKAAEGNVTKAKEFLAKNKTATGVKETESGLQYMVMKEGAGEKPKATDKVKVHYKGTLLDGTEFDSSYSRNKPIEFPLNGVIKGWTEGVQLMTPGSKYKFWIPPALGYGDKANAKIPGNSLLTFEVELLEVNPKPETK